MHSFAYYNFVDEDLYFFSIPRKTTVIPFNFFPKLYFFKAEINYCLKTKIFNFWGWSENAGLGIWPL